MHVYELSRAKALEQAEQILTEKSLSTDPYLQVQLHVVRLFVQWSQENWLPLVQHVYNEKLSDGLVFILIEKFFPESGMTEQEAIWIPVSVQILMEALYPDKNTGNFFEWFWPTLHGQLGIYEAAASPIPMPPGTRHQ